MMNNKLPVLLATLFWFSLASAVRAEDPWMMPASEVAPAPAPEAKPVSVLYYPATPEWPHPDDAPRDIQGQMVRDYMLDPQHSDWYFVPEAGQGGALLVVDKGYLDSAELKRVSSDIIEAAREIPQFIQRPPLVTKRFTMYIYDQGPASESNVPGAQPGEQGVMMKFVKDDKAPIFHELTHLLGGYSDSQSLAEGVADYVDNHFRPGKAHAFTPANFNCHLAAKKAVAKYSLRFFNVIGAPGYFYQVGDSDERFDFYFASWSFVDYLLSIGDMKQLWSVIDAGGKPEAYQKVYSLSFVDIKAGWRKRIGEEGKKSL